MSFFVSECLCYFWQAPKVYENVQNRPQRKSLRGVFKPLYHAKFKMAAMKSLEFLVPGNTMVYAF